MAEQERLATARMADVQSAPAGTIHLAEVVLFEHRGFGGAEWRTNLSYSYVGDFWNDKVSSIVVVCGIWQFFEHRDFGGRVWQLGPGYYDWVEAVGIPNDLISSFKAISI